MRALGAQVIARGRSFDDAWRAAARHAARSGARLVHPGREPALVAGAGTLALELLAQVDRPLDVVLAPVGVGSCVAGIAVTLAAFSPRTRVIGVAAANAPAMARAFTSGRCDPVAPAPTVADGLAVGVPVAETLALMRGRVAEIVTVDEGALSAAIATYARVLHQLAEGAGAAALAGAMARREALRGKRVAIVLSGGNITAATLRRVLGPVVPRVAAGEGAGAGRVGGRRPHARLGEAPGRGGAKCMRAANAVS
jgi:threonine dehydratase